jgi:hypothetical protein
MGYYLQAPSNHNKADFLCKEHGGRVITLVEASSIMNDPNSDCAVVCVVNNGIFEAAAYCYNIQEFHQFSDPLDTRPKIWLRFDDVNKIRSLVGY